MGGQGRERRRGNRMGGKLGKGEWEEGKGRGRKEEEGREMKDDFFY